MIDQHIKEYFSYIPQKIPGMLVTKNYNTLLIDSGLQSDMFNIICSTEEEGKALVQNSIDHFCQKELPFCWWVGFDSDPAWLTGELKNHGLKPAEEELVMRVNLNNIEWPLQSENYYFQEVRTSEQLSDFMRVMFSILPEEEKEPVNKYYQLAKHLIFNSDLHLLVGYVDDKPVATSSVFISCGIASIFGVIVDPNMRGQGLGKAATLSAMKKAKNEGCGICVLTATNDAKFLYEKIGFKGVKLMEVYS